MKKRAAARHDPVADEATCAQLKKDYYCDSRVPLLNDLPSYTDIEPVVQIKEMMID
jgi:hypothetical protein